MAWAEEPPLGAEAGDQWAEAMKSAWASVGRGFQSLPEQDFSSGGATASSAPPPGQRASVPAMHEYDRDVHEYNLLQAAAQRETLLRQEAAAAPSHACTATQAPHYRDFAAAAGPAPSQAMPGAQPHYRHFASSSSEPRIPPGFYIGIMQKSQPMYGFIRQEDSGDDIFVLPLACKSFGATLPPLGTRVVYTVEIDPKNGKTRAAQVKPAAGRAYFNAPDRTQLDPNEFTGIVTRRKSESQQFGFIHEDDTEEDVFFLPLGCPTFGGVLPEPGTRVIFEKVFDPLNAKVRAANVRLESSVGPSPSQQQPGPAGAWRGHPGAQQQQGYGPVAQQFSQAAQYGHPYGQGAASAPQPALAWQPPLAQAQGPCGEAQPPREDTAQILSALSELFGASR